MSVRRIKIISLIAFATSCNLVTEEYSLVYVDESPNSEFALKLEQVLEESYNVDIELSMAKNAGEVVDKLESGSVDMGLVENLMNVGDGIHTVVPTFPKVLHLFYRGEDPESIADLFQNKPVYIGEMGSVSYAFMMDLMDYVNVHRDSLIVTQVKSEADVMAIFSVLMVGDELALYSGYNLFSIDQDITGEGSNTNGIALRFPRVRPYVIPQNVYPEMTSKPVFTIATDMVYIVREGMGKIAVNDLTKSLFEHREQFVHVHPSFYFGITEDFDRSKLSYSLHEGSKAYLNRDEPGFFERYAELAGVLFTILLATISGAVSFGKRRRQKKKDKVDVFYAKLLEIKNENSKIKSVAAARELLHNIKTEQDKAFKMLIDEELEANESFRIYMELSKETAAEIKLKARSIKNGLV